MIFYLKQKDITPINFGSRFPLKCYGYASESALQHSITAAIGARLASSQLRINFSRYTATIIARLTSKINNYF